MEFQYLPFVKEELPIQKTFDLGGVNYSILVRYNDRFDFYTAEVYNNENELIFTNKFTYLENFLDTITEGLNTNIRIIPLITDDIAQEYPRVNRISEDNFDDVRLALL